MTEPTRIRAQVQGDKAVVRLRMAHEMESGQRRDSGGALIPAWHITEVTITHNGRPVITAEWGPGVSKNPYLQFTLKGARAGDRVGASWKDSRGASRSDEITIVA